MYPCRLILVYDKISDENYYHSKIKLQATAGKTSPINSTNALNTQKQNNDMNLSFSIYHA